MSIQEKQHYDDRTSSVSSFTVFGDDDQDRKDSRISFHHHLRTLSSASHASASASAITPVSQWAGKGVIASIRVRCRLWRIVSRVHNKSDIPPQFFRDLIELQRPVWCGTASCGQESLIQSLALYPEAVRTKAWGLVIQLIRSPHVDQVADALLSFPQGVVKAFLGSTVRENPSSPPSPPCNDITVATAIIAAIQRKRPTILNDFLRLEDLCFILTKSRGAFQDCRDFPVSFVIQALAPSMQFPLPSLSTQHHGRLSQWDLPSFARCFLTFLLSGTSVKLQETVVYIVSSISLYAREYPSWRAAQGDPCLSIRAASIHPMLPFIHLAIHLAYHSDVAAKAFVQHGLLILTGRLWLYDFPDPFAPARATSDIRADMRAGCLLLLGALTRHYPAARELADHLSTLNIKQHHSPDPRVIPRMSHIPLEDESSTISIVGIETHPDLANPVPPLVLFMMETCVANAVPISIVDYMLDNPWASLLDVFT